MVRTTRRGRSSVLTSLGVVFALGLAACGGGVGGDDEKASDKKSSTTEQAGGEEISGAISVDGSSTVGPLTTAAAELFESEYPDVKVTVGTSGTGGGFEKFCKGEIDMAGASREIKPEEAAACEKAGIEYSKFQVANDGIAVVVNLDNDWVDCLTVPQLKKIWDDGSTVKTWKDVDPKFPAEKIDLYGPGTDSGTFDFFTKAINGVEDQSRSDYSATEADNLTVEGVSGAKGGLGYFGLSYYEENTDKLKLLGVDGGKGCVTPDTEMVQSGTYAPLSRPLFVYPSADLLARPEGLAFVEFYLGNTSEITKQALFVDLNTAQLAEVKKELAALKAGE